MKKEKKKILSFILAVVTIFIAAFTPAITQAAVSWPSFNSSSPIKTYTLSTGNNTPAYSDCNLNNQIGTIYASDELYIQSIGTNASGTPYCKLSYPISGGKRKEAYIPLNTITSAVVPGETGTASTGITTYCRASSANKAGAISKGDIVYKMAESGSYVQVLYNIGSASNPSGWRMAWITKNNYSNYVNISQDSGPFTGMIDVTAYFAGKTITIQSVQNGKYMCADANYNDTALMCNKDTPLNWETFTISEITPDGWVGIKAWTNNKNLSATYSITDTPVRACTDNLLLWECFRFYLRGDDFFIKAQVNNQWLSARVDKEGVPVEAYGPKPLDWERFKLRFSGQTQYITAEEVKTALNINNTQNNTQTNNWQMPMDNAYCTWRSKETWSWGTYTNNSSSRDYHIGIDIYGTNGTVYAANAGKVVAASSSASGANGRYIIIQHMIDGKTIYSFYAHLNSLNVSVGQTVSTGEKIGVAGGSGYGKNNYYGTHLHFAVVDALWSGGTYYGYATYFTGDKVTYSGVTYYNPLYVINYNKLP